MKRNTKLTALFLALTMMVGLLAGCGGKKEEAPAAKEETKTEAPAATEKTEEKTTLMDKPMTFKVCITENPDTIMGTEIPVALAAITERTNGEINFEFCPSAQLGSNPEVMEQLINGAPVITAAGFDNLSAFVEACNAACVPYVFESIEEIFKFAETDLWSSMKADIISAGYQPIALGSWGLRCFISTNPITCADDIKGQIVRMGNSAASQNFAAVMGGTPATSAWADNYSLLQSGAIDACEAPVDLLYSSSLYEVCDYLCISNHLATPGMFVISPAFWEQIPAEYQAIMEEEFAAALVKVADGYIASQGDYIAKFKEAGTEVCEDPDIASFAAYLPELFEIIGADPAEYTAIREALK